VSGVKTIDLKPEAEMVREVKKHFPHQSMRRFQGDLADQVYSLLDSNVRDIVVEAPTGLGKA